MARGAEVTARFAAEHREVQVVPVAAQRGDVHDIDGLRAIGAGLGERRLYAAAGGLR